MKQKYLNIIVCGIIGLVIGLTGLLYYFFKEIIPFNIIYKSELASIDSKINLLSRLNFNKADSPVMVLAIDEATFANFEQQLPSGKLPRSVYTDLIEQLNKMGASVIGIDMVFKSSEDSLNADDKNFIDTIKKYKNVILAQTYSEYSELKGINLTRSFNEYIPEDYFGVVNLYPDLDGIIRRFKYQGFYFNKVNFNTMKEEVKYYPGFAISIVNKHKPGFISQDEINNPDKYNRFINFSDFTNSLTVMPVYNFFKDKIIFMSKQGKLNKDIVRGKIVLIGDTTPTSHDYFTVPVNNYYKTSILLNEKLMPGVLIHAFIINTILTGRTLTTFNPFLNIIIVTGLCVIMALTLLRVRNVAQALLLIISILALYSIFSYLMFIEFKMITTIVFPTIQIFLTGFICYIFIYFAVNREKIYIYKSFSKYVSPQIAKIAAENIEKLSTTKKTVTLLFSDIADFTTITEQSDPATISKMLNEYLNRMAKIVFKYNGTLDKYIGDAVMAFWGAPIDIDEAELNTCKAALEMIKEVQVINKEFSIQNLPDFNIRIGINTAEVMVGNLGGDLFNYTAIGDGVNLASRLEGANKEFNSSILISNNTFQLVKEKIVARELGIIKVKGKIEPVKVYELLGLKGENEDLEKIVELFNQAVCYYEQKALTRAEEIINSILELNPDDAVAKKFQSKILSDKTQNDSISKDAATYAEEK